MKMKTIASLSIAFVFTFGLPYALVAGNSATTSAGQIHHGSGIIETIDPIKGTVTMEHEPIESLKWPKMVMTFTAKDPTQLKDLKEDDKVEFDLVQSGKVYLITRIQQIH
jgi:Cu/Ag efflux protein CusF